MVTPSTHLLRNRHWSHPGPLLSLIFHIQPISKSQDSTFKICLGLQPSPLLSLSSKPPTLLASATSISSSQCPCFHVCSLHSTPKSTTEILTVSPTQSIHSLPTMFRIKSKIAPWSTKNNTVWSKALPSVVFSTFFLLPGLQQH